MMVRVGALRPVFLSPLITWLQTLAFVKVNDGRKQPESDSVRSCENVIACEYDVEIVHGGNKCSITHEVQIETANGMRQCRPRPINYRWVHSYLIRWPRVSRNSRCTSVLFTV